MTSKMTTPSNTMSANLMAGWLSRAATEREGRAAIKPMTEDAPLPALDSIPTSIIDAVGGQDGLREASTPSFGQSCPQPSRSEALNNPMCRLGQVKQDRRESANKSIQSVRRGISPFGVADGLLAVGMRRKGRRTASAYGARTAASAAPLTLLTGEWSLGDQND